MPIVRKRFNEIADAITWDTVQLAKSDYLDDQLQANVDRLSRIGLGGEPAEER